MWCLLKSREDIVISNTDLEWCNNTPVSVFRDKVQLQLQLSISSIRCRTSSRIETAGSSFPAVITAFHGNLPVSDFVIKEPAQFTGSYS